MANDPTPAERPLRRDAERNRQRILDAARVVFAERGLRGSHNDIAREAQVGVGTVYRRFPDKEQLIDALFEERMEEVVALAEAAAAQDDPWDGVVHFLAEAQELQSADRALKELMVSREGGSERMARARDRIEPILSGLLEQAQANGTVRDDIDLTDIAVVQIAVGAVADATRDIAPEVWRRTLTIMLAGLRAGAERPDFTVLPLTMEQFEAAMHANAVPKHR